MRIAPHLHRLGNDVVASYLIELPEGITLIDAGLPGHWRDLQRELRALHRPLSDVRGLVLTHGDSDHIGFAERLRRESGAPVFVHAADARRARTGDKPKTPMGPARLLPTVEFLAYAMRKGALRSSHPATVYETADGDRLDLPGSPLILSLPGHSPGSIGVHVPAVRALFVGDALTTRHVLTGRRGVQPAPFTDDPGLAAASLDRLAEVDADWVLPGHGAPWHGTPSELATAMRAAVR